MQVRKKLRRIKRFAYLGAFTGTVIAVRRTRQQRASSAPLGPPAAWPPLEPSGEAPVAALGDLAAEPASAAGVTAEAAAVAEAAGVTESFETPAAAPIESPLADTAGAWVAPLDDGSCPLSHPIKANDNSRIFHEPGGRFYDRTRAERCYVDAAAAAADGYRPAKGADGPQDH